MTWAALLLTALAIGGIIYWLLVLGEGAYLGNPVVVALYDWSAARYDAIKGVLVHEDGIHLARPLLEKLQRAASPLVLDVATGTGRLPLALLRQLNFRGRIVGLDPARRMLAVAQSKTRVHCLSVAWIRDDATALPFRGSSFDAVTCVEALEFLPSPEQALTEMVRVLRPGGQLMLSNRVGMDALFLPGRAYRPRALEEKLEALGLTHVRTRRWQTHYDLIDAQKGKEERGGQNDETEIQCCARSRNPMRERDEPVLRPASAGMDSRDHCGSLAQCVSFCGLLWKRPRRQYHGVRQWLHVHQHRGRSAALIPGNHHHGGSW